MSVPKPMGGPYVGGVNMPNSGASLHFHGPDANTLTGGYFKTYGGEAASPQFLNGYECAMADLYAQQAGLDRNFK